MEEYCFENTSNKGFTYNCDIFNAIATYKLIFISN